MDIAEITINGTPTKIVPEVTIATLLRARGIPPEMVVVEFNGRALTPSEAKSVRVQNGDALEVVKVVAGG